MVNLKRASYELFRRSPDERFPSVSALAQHCLLQREQSREVWQPPGSIRATVCPTTDRLTLSLSDEEQYLLNDWSFGQLCRLAGVSKETVNRLSPATADRVFAETLPQGEKPMQLFTDGQYLLFVILLAFSILLPIAKLILLFRFWHAESTNNQQLEHFMNWITHYGKWSMLDVFVVALLVVIVKLGVLASVIVHYGIYMYAGAGLLIMIVTTIINSVAEKELEKNPSIGVS